MRHRSLLSDILRGTFYSINSSPRSYFHTRANDGGSSYTEEAIQASKSWIRGGDWVTRRGSRLRSSLHTSLVRVCY